MKRELSVGLCMIVGFSVTYYLFDGPVWASAISAWISGMWADLRMGR